ncbi:MAG TPA: hypothetical protein VKR56_14675 [Candidatus Cybelea sp.]|nr:hypothetical protein [Candidatus Cybelea sp.]
MRFLNLTRCALTAGVAATLLSACAASSSLPNAGDTTSDAPAKLDHTKTFLYSGGSQTFVVPSGVTQLSVDARGGQGAGTSRYPSEDPPGFPGRVRAVIPVKPGETLYVFVGGSGKKGGFNGGGAGGPGGSSKYKGNSGGGASDVRVGGSALGDRIIVAAGGGGAGLAVDAYGYGYGGNGGGLSGEPGGDGGGSYCNHGHGGLGGTQSAGGTGGAGGECTTSKKAKSGGDGALGTGGAGGSARYSSCSQAGGGGGGGGGYYGGGGGGAGIVIPYYGCRSAGNGGGGGGGSSYVESTATKSHMWTGWKAKGDGIIVLGWN